MENIISEEEMNALLNNAPNNANQVKAVVQSASGENKEEERLSTEETDAIGEISNISMGAAATSLSTLLNQKVIITTPVVSYTTWDELAGDYDRPCVAIQISYKEGLDGNNVLLLKTSDAQVIADLMMGGDGKQEIETLEEIHLSAIGETMNQMMGASATALSSMFEEKVDITPPIAKLIDLNDEMSDAPEFLEGIFVKVSFKMQLGELVDSELMQLYPISFAKLLYQRSLHLEKERADQPRQSEQKKRSEQPAYQAMPVQNVNVQPAQFTPFQYSPGASMETENIDLISDVPLEVTVELGRINKSIKEVLEFAPGTIVELNKIAGEPVDVLVNGKMVAKGEVVVIEESFGIRITDIIR